jgi:hypothetical protein
MSLSDDLLIRLDVKIDTIGAQIDINHAQLTQEIGLIKDSLSDQKTQMALVEAAHRTLYSRVESHALEPCNNLMKHENAECDNVGRHIAAWHKLSVKQIIIWLGSICAIAVAAIEILGAVK